MAIQCLYRFSDNLQLSSGGKNRSPQRNRPLYFSKLNCLLNFISVFGKDNINIIADTVSDENYNKLIEIFGDHNRVIRTNYKND